jgi:hypothetical protein
MILEEKRIALAIMTSVGARGGRKMDRRVGTRTNQVSRWRCPGYPYPPCNTERLKRAEGRRHGAVWIDKMVFREKRDC